MMALLTIVWAAELAVPSDDYATLDDAIAVAGAGDTVLLAPGTYLLESEIPVGLSIVGSGRRQTFLTGEGNFVVYQAPDAKTDVSSPTVVRSLAIDGGQARAGVYIGLNAGALTFEDVEVFDTRNVDENSAAGISVWGGQLTCLGCVLHDNISNARKGGALQVRNARLLLRDGRIHHNAAVYGGGLSATGDTPDYKVEIHGTSFCDNTATGDADSGGYGGAIEAAYGLDIDTSMFVGNRGDFGGAIFAFEGVVDLQHLTFLDNRAAFGAAVEHRDANLLLRDSIIAGSAGPALGLGDGVMDPTSGHNLWFDNDEGVVLREGDVEADPQLANPVTDCDEFDLTPALTSPAVGAASGEGLFDVIGAVDVVVPEPVDADGDGHSEGEDCDDADPLVNADAVEVDCDGVDNDCSAETPDCPEGLSSSCGCGVQPLERAWWPRRR